MTVDLERTRNLVARPPQPTGDRELRREANVFFVGAALPARPTLETVFESDCQAPVELFAFRFEDASALAAAGELIQLLKRNFKGYLLAWFAKPPPLSRLDDAYAAGIDLLDLPLSGAALDDGRLEALAYARTVFPRWATLSTLTAGEAPPETICRTIDALLEREVLPLVTVGEAAARQPVAAIAGIFEHLERGWRRHRATIKPVQPLLPLTTPFSDPPPRGVIGGLIEKVCDAGLRTGSDLRRQLRVRQVQESFESAGL